ncbi:cytochrome C [Geomonas azotofigens]|uniref:cytochrome C n=1 Tax=Geomonas azotofigens TaxID=2843196 RepID=UPI001C102BFC|nr:cytochrome C [Geomonas azotofigens]MBU5614944.1 cytochrome C [Geomonas azotofigens]
MKKLLVTMLLVAATATVAHAGLKVVGKGDAMRLDPSGFPPAMKANYEIVRVKCVKCHTLERTIVAIQTGVAPISGQPFDRNATKAYGIKMLRKPDSNMTKAEVKASVELMNYLLSEAEK